MSVGRTRRCSVTVGLCSRVAADYNTWMRLFWLIGTSVLVMSSAAHADGVGALELQPVTLDECKQHDPAMTKVVGKACVNSGGMMYADRWTLGETTADWNADHWKVGYEWTPPARITTSSTIALAVFATELTKNPNARICPKLGASGLLVKDRSKATAGECAPSGSSKKHEATVELQIPSGRAGDVVWLAVGIQDGPGYAYKYRAAAGQRTEGPPAFVLAKLAVDLKLVGDYKGFDPPGGTVKSGARITICNKHTTVLVAFTTSPGAKHSTLVKDRREGRGWRLPGTSAKSGLAPGKCTSFVVNNPTSEPVAITFLDDTSSKAELRLTVAPKR